MRYKVNTEKLRRLSLDVIVEEKSFLNRNRRDIYLG